MLLLLVGVPACIARDDPNKLVVYHSIGASFSAPIQRPATSEIVVVVGGIVAPARLLLVMELFQGFLGNRPKQAVVFTSFVSHTVDHNLGWQGWGQILFRWQDFIPIFLDHKSGIFGCECHCDNKGTSSFSFFAAAHNSGVVFLCLWVGGWKMHAIDATNAFEVVSLAWGAVTYLL